jgi:hypothetical protein
MNQKAKSAVPLWPQKRTQFRVVRVFRGSKSSPRFTWLWKGSPGWFWHPRGKNPLIQESINPFIQESINPFIQESTYP